MTDERYPPGRIELEEKVAFLQKTVLELNEALVDQSRTIIDLGQRVEALERVVRGISQELAVSRARPPNEKPPHY